MLCVFFYLLHFPTVCPQTRQLRKLSLCDVTTGTICPRLVTTFTVRCHRRAPTAFVSSKRGERSKKATVYIRRL